jgi:phage baseplate assembly protein W
MSYIERFFKEVPEKRSVIRDIDAVIDSSGDFKRLENIDVVMRSIINIFLTPRGTYLMEPDYGSELYKYIFEPHDEITRNDIYNELTKSVKLFEDRAVITYDVFFMRNQDGFIVNIYVSFRGEKRKTTITIDESLLRTVVG